MSFLEIEAERAQLRLLFLSRLLAAERGRELSPHFYQTERPLSHARVCVPVRVIDLCGDVVLTCPSFCLSRLRQAAETEKDASYAALFAAADAILRPMGLFPLRAQPRRRVLSAARTVPAERGPEAAVCLNAQRWHGLENRTGVALPDSFFDAGGLAYAVCRDDTVLSVAVSQPPRRDAVAREIGCATAAEARRRGYAALCVRALAHALSSQGGLVLYRADAENTASLATARSAGLFEIASIYNPAMKRGKG